MRIKGSKNTQYKIRQLTTKNKSGDAYGITIPSEIAMQFKECFFSVSIDGDKIILNSGCNIKDKGLNDNFKSFTISKEKGITIKRK